MKKILLSFLLICLTVHSFAQAPSTLKHSSTSYVDDYANMFTPDQAYALDQIIRKFHDTVQISLVTINSLDGLEPSDYAVKLGNLWGVGSKSNNGLLILICPSAHQFFAATGGGIQGDLTDAQCGSLYRQIAKPLYKEGKYYEGTLAVLNEYINVLSPSAKEFRDKQEAAIAAHNKKQNDKMLAVVGNILLFLLAVGLIIFGIVRLRRKQAKDRADFDELKHQFNVRVKLARTLQSSFGNSKEFSELQQLEVAFIKLKLNDYTEFNWKKNHYQDYINRFDQYTADNKSIMKELENKKAIKAEKERQEREVAQRKLDAITKAKGVLKQLTTGYYENKTSLVSITKMGIEHLAFDKTNYTHKISELEDCIDRIRKSATNLASIVDTEETAIIIKAIAEIDNHENNFRLKLDTLNNVIKADNEKINIAKNAKDTLEREVTKLESYVNKKGVSNKAAIKTKEQCLNLRNQLNNFSDGLSIVEMYALYMLLSPMLDYCSEAKDENFAYEQEEQRKRDEENRRLAAIAAEEERVRREEENRRRRQREEEDAEERRRQSSYNSSSYSSYSDSSSSSSYSSSSDSSSSFGGGGFDGGGGGGSW